MYILYFIELELLIYNRCLIFKAHIGFSGECQHCYTVSLKISRYSSSYYESVDEWLTYSASVSLLKIGARVRFPCYSSGHCGHESEAHESCCKFNPRLSLDHFQWFWLIYLFIYLFIFFWVRLEFTQISQVSVHYFKSFSWVKSEMKRCFIKINK